MTSATDAVRLPQLRWGRIARRHGWTFGVWVLLIAALAWYASLIPRFGGFEATTIAAGALPIAYLAMAQAVVVLVAGIDLATGAMLVLANSVSAVLMEGQGFAVAGSIAVAIVLGAGALNAGVGWVITASRVPDIVVTLATLFIFSGVALLVLPGPGGGANPTFRYLLTGSEVGIGSNFWPPLIAIVIPLALVWFFLQRTRAGLSLYAVGSDQQAAFLSGLRVGKARVIAYGIAGALSALGGLATTALTGIGEPDFVIALDNTLNSVAAVVLGGIALTGGVGSVLGAVAAGYVLYMLSPIMTALGIDPNNAQVVQGVVIVVVVMAGGYIRLRREET